MPSYVKFEPGTRWTALAKAVLHEKLTNYVTLRPGTQLEGADQAIRRDRLPSYVKFGPGTHLESADPGGSARYSAELRQVQARNPPGGR